ncbi:MAG: twin-arginine translocation pathway signal, partial [Pirellulaceae bacterium]
MIFNLTRRFVVKLLALGAFLGFGKKRAQGAKAAALIETEQIDQWQKTHDRVWIGGEFWSNPMEDWRVNEGWAQCQTTAGNRSIHSVTRQIKDTAASFAMSVELSESAPIKNNMGAGFRIGVRS